MAIPANTTTISIQRPDGLIENDRDPWERDEPGEEIPDPPTIANGIRAVVDLNTGQAVGPGQTQVADFILTADPCELAHTDFVTDERTGQAYAVDWAVPVPGLPGLDHVQAGLNTVSGFGNP